MTTTETTTTPALNLAGGLYALAEHLVEHPHLPNVNIDGRGMRTGMTLQIAVYKHLGEQGGVAALLAWAKTFDDPKVELSWHDEKNLVVTVDIIATIDGHSVRVWDTDGGDLYRWRTGGKFAHTPITLGQLAAYVAAGTVEHAAESGAA